LHQPDSAGFKQNASNHSGAINLKITPSKEDRHSNTSDQCGNSQ
jgi:hypothetical protein